MQLILLLHYEELRINYNTTCSFACDMYIHMAASFTPHNRHILHLVYRNFNTGIFYLSSTQHGWTIRKYGGTFYVGIGQVKNDRLYGSSSGKTTAN